MHTNRINRHHLVFLALWLMGAMTVSCDDGASVDAGPSDMTDDAMTDDAMTDDAMVDDAMTDDAMTDDAMTDDAMTDDAMTDDAMTDDAMTDDAMTDGMDDDVDMDDADDTMTDDMDTDDTMTDDMDDDDTVDPALAILEKIDDFRSSNCEELDALVRNFRADLFEFHLSNEFYVVDYEILESCLDGVLAWASSCEGNGLDELNSDECWHYYEGAMPDGSACSSRVTDTCQSGECEVDDSSADGLCGQCVPTLNECANNLECTGGQECYFNYDNGFKVCADVPSVGDDCVGAIRRCGPGAECNETAGVCVEIVVSDVGGPCEVPQTECAEGLLCDRWGPMPTNTCALPTENVAVGQPCRRHVDTCQAGSTCGYESEICVAQTLVAIGAECNGESTICGDTASCDAVVTGTCLPLVADGEPCGSGVGSCLDGASCNGTVCVRPAGLGEPCSETVYCGSGEDVLLSCSPSNICLPYHEVLAERIELCVEP